MRESIITGVLALSGVILSGVVGMGVFMSDRNAPTIHVEGKNSLTYTEGEGYETLLKDVSAEDKEDGDVTDSLRVSSLYKTEDNKAIVLYVAKDKANNIGKLKREVYYQAGQGNAGSENDGQTAEDRPEEDTVQPQETPTVPADGPVLTMIQKEATLKVGENFNILRYVQEALDRDGSSLSKYIHVDGAYNMNQPGVYSIKVYAVNLNGETSNIETFTLTVEP